MRRLRPLSEEECYARCYGTADENVRIVRPLAGGSRFPAYVSGERIRRLFEQRLDAREPETEPEAA